MAIYMISYDLHAPTNNREKVEEAIKSLGNWCKYLTTTFLVSTTKSAEEVQRIAVQHHDTNDNMIICATQKPIYGYLHKDRWAWIDKNL